MLFYFIVIENPTCYNVSARTPEGLNPNNMQHGAESSLSDMFNSGGLSSGMVDMFAHRDIPIPPYIQNSNGGSSFGMVDMPIMSSQYMFGSDGKISEAGPNVGNASPTPITSTLHSVNESDSDFPYTYLSQSLSREYSLSDMPDYLFSGMFSLFCFYVIMHGCV
jgi:hypothetical protein